MSKMGQELERRLDENKYELLGACRILPERKDMLAEAAYTGGDIPKKWIHERGLYTDGYNQALTDVRNHFAPILAKIEDKK